MARAFTQAQKFGAEFSLSTEVTRLDCTPESSGLILHILELGDGRRVRARGRDAIGARYRRPEIRNSRSSGRGVCTGVACHSAVPQRGRALLVEETGGQAAVFSQATRVTARAGGPGLSSTPPRYSSNG
jgi:thioredoxin reductase (NADPH)